jgi:hypothetical protein
MKTPIHWMLAMLLSASLAGCDYSNDDHDHKVPDGKGSLIVDNNTTDDIAVFIDGARANNADAYESKSFDLDPGVHRVVLDQRGGTGSFRGDVDVLEGKRTIMDVGASAIDNEYDVAIFFK